MAFEHILRSCLSFDDIRYVNDGYLALRIAVWMNIEFELRKYDQATDEIIGKHSMNRVDVLSRLYYLEENNRKSLESKVILIRSYSWNENNNKSIREEIDDLDNIKILVNDEIYISKNETVSWNKVHLTDSYKLL